MYKYSQSRHSFASKLIYLLLFFLILLLCATGLLFWQYKKNQDVIKQLQLEEKRKQQEMLQAQLIINDTVEEKPKEEVIEPKTYPKVKAEKEGYPVIEAEDGRENLGEPYILENVILVNRKHPVNWDYVPPLENTGKLQPEAMQAFQAMLSKAQEDGIQFYLRSAYRSFDEQVRVRNYYLDTDPGGLASVDTYSAPPGASEHQTGLALDLDNGEGLDEHFDETPAGTWLHENAYKFGFIIRFPKDKENITGYRYEPWHFRYVGIDIAQAFGPHNQLTLEEYLKSEPAPAPDYSTQELDKVKNPTSNPQSSENAGAASNSSASNTTDTKN